MVEAEPWLDVAEGGHGYVETYSSGIKNTRSRKRRRIRIAVVGPACGLDGRNWAETWLQLRVEEGLAVESQGCLMPAPDPEGGGWCQRALTCEESRKGLDASGVDHKSNRHKAVAPILVLGLTTKTS